MRRNGANPYQVLVSEHWFAAPGAGKVRELPGSARLDAAVCRC